MVTLTDRLNWNKAGIPRSPPGVSVPPLPTHPRTPPNEYNSPAEATLPLAVYTLSFSALLTPPPRRSQPPPTPGSGEYLLAQLAPLNVHHPCPLASRCPSRIPEFAPGFARGLVLHLRVPRSCSSRGQWNHRVIVLRFSCCLGSGMESVRSYRGGLTRGISRKGSSNKVSFESRWSSL